MPATVLSYQPLLLMPELPEVETVVRDLRKKVKGLTILEVKIHDGRVVRENLQDFCRKLKGSTMTNVSRRGKAIIIETLGVRDWTLEKNSSVSFLIVQLMMTGQMIYSSSCEPARDTKVTFRLSNGECLHYNDFRTFGRLQVVNALSEIGYFGRLGPEPLEKDFTFLWLKQALAKKTTPIKPLLLNHQFVAGIGNIYASEILFASRIHPLRRAGTLKDQEIVLLHRNIREILKEAIRFRGTSMNTYRDTKGEKGNFMNRIKVYGREKETCFSCPGLLAKTVQSGRSTFYCPSCQK